MSTWTAQSKNSSSWTAQSKSGPSASAGQYYGFGAFTYSGGQNLTGQITWTALNKS